MTLKIDDFVFLEGSLASGILQIGDGGLAGKILLQSEAVDPLAGLGIEGLSFSTDTRFDLLLNTAGKIHLRLIDNENPAVHSGRGPVVGRACASLSPLPGAVLEGTFDLEAQEEYAVMAVNATLSIEVGQATLLDLAANGFLKLDGSGVAGKVQLQLLSEIPADDPRRWGA